MPSSSTPRPTRLLLARTAFAALLATVLLTLAGACRSAPEVEAEPLSEAQIQTPPPPFALGPGDLVRITVAGVPEMGSPPDGERIDANGDLDVPYVGTVRLGGVPLPEARRRLREAVAPYTRGSAVVTLNVMEYLSREFHVFGQVAEPGAIPLDRRTTALEALARAGGFAAFADRRRVALLRVTPEQELRVHFFDGDTPDLGGFLQVHPGDLIFVRQTGAGTFRDQLQPIVQGIIGPLSVLSSLIVVSESLTD